MFSDAMNHEISKMEMFIDGSLNAALVMAGLYATELTVRKMGSLTDRFLEKRRIKKIGKAATCRAFFPN